MVDATCETLGLDSPGQGKKKILEKGLFWNAF